MMHTFGEPPGPVQIQLVTDSSASISILEKTKNRVGLKDVMTPDVEIALAILHQQEKTPWTKFTPVKVQSHIDVTDAPDEFLWQVNFHSDRLATEAREKVNQQELEARPPCLLDGMKVGCFINGNLVYTALKDTVMAHLHSQTMKSYLQNKYNWSETEFNRIDWTSHAKGLASFTNLQQITVTKYIHGWLATKRRRFRQGIYDSPLCPLCFREETDLHLFTCSYERMAEFRRRQFLEFDKALHRSVPPQTVSAIQSGMRSIGTPGITTLYTDKFTTDSTLRQAMLDQESIGWDHFLKGRLSNKWKDQQYLPTFTKNPDSWSKTIIIDILQMTCRLWQQRNCLIHGNDGEVSKLAVQQTRDIVELVYSDLLPHVDPQHNWMFTTSIEDKIFEHYSLHVAWLDGIRRLYPEKYHAVVQSLRQQNLIDKELEYTKSSRGGPAQSM